MCFDFNQKEASARVAPKQSKHNANDLFTSSTLPHQYDINHIWNWILHISPWYHLFPRLYHTSHCALDSTYRVLKSISKAISHFPLCFWFDLSDLEKQEDRESLATWLKSQLIISGGAPCPGSMHSEFGPSDTYCPKLLFPFDEPGQPGSRLGDTRPSRGFPIEKLFLPQD